MKFQRLIILLIIMVAGPFCLVRAQTPTNVITTTASSVVTNGPVPVPVIVDPGAVDTSKYAAIWRLVIGIITPLIILGVSKIPKLPRNYLPVLAPFVGLLIDWGLSQVNGMHLPWWDAAQAGALGVFIREVINQAVTRPMTPPEKQLADAEQEVRRVRRKLDLNTTENLFNNPYL